MKRSERWNTLQICPRRDSNTGGSDLWSNTLPLDHGGALSLSPPLSLCVCVCVCPHNADSITRICPKCSLEFSIWASLLVTWSDQLERDAGPMINEVREIERKRERFDRCTIYLAWSHQVHRWLPAPIIPWLARGLASRWSLPLILLGRQLERLRRFY